MAVHRNSIKAGVLGLLALTAAGGLAGCSSSRENQYVQGSIDYLYNLGYDLMEHKRYDDAVKLFDEVERQYPYSVWARRAQLMSAYASYLSNDYAEAILAAQRFINLHPGNRDAAYAYYLVAICHYEQITDVGRDQQSTQDALDALTDVVRRFPGTAYAKDARMKIDLTRDHLAGKEMEVGRFYQTQRNYVAAQMRFNNVIHDYGTTSHVPEALHRLTEVYLAMGLAGEAVRSTATLGYNFPDSRWYRDSYNLLRSHDLLTPENTAQLPKGEAPKSHS